MALNLKHPAIELLHIKLGELSWLNSWQDLDDLPNLSYYLSLLANELNIPDGDYIEFVDELMKDSQWDLDEVVEQYSEVAKKVYQIYDENRQIRISISDLKNLLEQVSKKESTVEEICNHIKELNPVNK